MKNGATYSVVIKFAQQAFMWHRLRGTQKIQDGYVWLNFVVKRAH